MNDGPIQPTGQCKTKTSALKFLLLALVPSLCGLGLLKIDSRGGEGVTAIFLMANLFCTLAIGFGVTRSRIKSSWIRIVAALLISLVLFFINWGVLIFVDLIFFNPVRS
jgi:hypothetical protein